VVVAAVVLLVPVLVASWLHLCAFDSSSSNNDNRVPSSNDPSFEKCLQTPNHNL